jgi:hypothetical protein
VLARRVLGIQVTNWVRHVTCGDLRNAEPVRSAARRPGGEVVSTWGQFGDWIATLAVASFAWLSSVVSPNAPNGSPAINASPADQNQLSSIMSWAQQEDEPPIEQVGEDSDEDVETLDEAEPPADEPDTTEDVELLDQGPPADAVDDVELLDQGPSATAAPVASAGTTVPVTTDVAPAVSNGPFVPEGFGTTNVQVATGSAGFPVGLADCHVGAVTGRAYVGIGCGEGGDSSFVGHAPSFEEFPFVLEEGFPFNREGVFADPAAGQPENTVETLVSAARGTPLNEDAAVPVIRTSGASSVEFEQRARGRNADVESENGRSARGNDSRRGGNAGTASSESRGQGGRSQAESRHGTKQKHGKSSHRDGAAKDNGKKSKSAKHAKSNGGKQGKKHRASK